MNYDKIVYYDKYSRPITIREHIFNKEKKRLLSSFNNIDNLTEVYNSIPYCFYMEDSYNGYTYGISPLQYIREFVKNNYNEIENYLK